LVAILAQKESPAAGGRFTATSTIAKSSTSGSGENELHTTAASAEVGGGGGAAAEVGAELVHRDWAILHCCGAATGKIRLLLECI